MDVGLYPFLFLKNVVPSSVFSIRLAFELSWCRLVI